MRIPRSSSVRPWLGALSVVLALALLTGATPRTKRAARKAPAPKVIADPDPADTQVVSTARWARFPLLPDGRFPIGAWCAPPPLQSTDFRYVEYAHAGLNVSMLMLEDPFLPGPTLDRLRVSARHDVYAIVRDMRVMPGTPYDSGWRANVDSMVSLYSSHAALLGYFLADEPGAPFFSPLAALNRRFAQRDKEHPGYVNLMGFPGPGRTYDGLPYSLYLRRYIERAHPAFFSFDHYPLLKRSDAPYFITGLDSTAYVSRQTGVPFWAILQLTPHLNLRKPTQAEMAWQANLSLAHGARGIVWFTYWTPNPTEKMAYRDGPISYDGKRNSSYNALVDLNGKLQLLGQEMTRFTPLGVRHVGQVPYGCKAFQTTPALNIQSETPLAVGFFREGQGRTYALLVNRDYKRQGTVRIIAPDTLLRWTKALSLYRPLEASPNSLGGVRNDISLAPGDAELIRLPRDFDYLSTQ